MYMYMYLCTHTHTQSSSKRKKEQERSAVLVERLQEERQRQEDNHRLVMARLKQERDSWFSASGSVCVMVDEVAFTLQVYGTDNVMIYSCRWRGNPLLAYRAHGQ